MILLSILMGHLRLSHGSSNSGRPRLHGLDFFSGHLNDRSLGGIRLLFTLGHLLLRGCHCSSHLDNIGFGRFRCCFHRGNNRVGSHDRLFGFSHFRGHSGEHLGPGSLGDGQLIDSSGYGIHSGLCGLLLGGNQPRQLGLRAIGKGPFIRAVSLLRQVIGLGLGVVDGGGV